VLTSSSTYEYFTNRIIYIDELTLTDKFFAVVAVLSCWRATRRVIGWALPITAIAFLVYAAFFTKREDPVLMSRFTSPPRASSAPPSACRPPT